jgi:hypothetical protein
MAVLITTTTVSRKLATRLVMAVAAAVETLDIGLLGRRTRRRGLRVGGEDSRWDGS